MDNLVIYIFAISILLTGFIMYWLKVAGRKIFFSTTNWFLCLQLPFLIGTIQAFDPLRREDVIWLFTVIGGTLCFFVGAYLANTRKAFDPRVEIAEFCARPIDFDLQYLPYSVLVLGMGALCIVVGTIFILSIQTNVFVWAVTNFMSSGGDISQDQYGAMRTAITTGREGYVAPGYTLQFVAVIMPTILYLLYFRVRQTKRPFEIILGVTLLLGDLYFITAFGTRGQIIFLALVFIALVSKFGPVPEAWKSARKMTYIVFALLIMFYGVSTILMGRVDTNPATGNLLEAAGGTIYDFYDRTTGAYASEMLSLVRYLMTQPIGWGAEWLQALSSMIPGGTKGYGFANEMSLFLYGAIEGNVGLNVYASMFYNLGLAGSLIGFALLGFVLQTFTINYVRGERKITRVVILFALGFRLAMFRDPYSLFLEGFVTLFIYYLLVLVLKERRLPLRFRPRKDVPSADTLVPAG
jgi:hypothetical protein